MKNERADSGSDVRVQIVRNVAREEHYSACAVIANDHHVRGPHATNDRQRHTKPAATSTQFVSRQAALRYSDTAKTSTVLQHCKSTYTEGHLGIRTPGTLGAAGG